MNDKFTIFMVCATVVQSSFATLSQTTSGIQAATLDSSIVHGYHAVARYQSNKAIHSIFTLESQGLLAKIDPREKHADEDKLYITKTCKDIVLPSWLAASHAVLEAILTVDPEAFSAVNTARTTGDATETNLIEGICSAIVLALGENSSGRLAKIKTIADKQASGAVTYNAAIFAAIRNGRSAPLKIKSTMENIESKATSELVAAIYHCFEGIETLMSFDTESESKNLSTAVGIIQNRVFSGIEADLNIKFEFLQTLFTASYIIQFGIAANFSGSEAVKVTLFPGYNQEINGDATRSKNDKCKVFSCNKSESIPGDSEIENARELSTFQAVQGVKTIFNTIKKGLAVVSPRNEKIDKSYSSNIESGRIESTAAYLAALDTIFRTIPPTHPAATVAVQNAAVAIVRKGIAGIYMGINATQGGNYVKILMELQSLEDTATCDFLKAVTEFYVGIRKGQKCDDKTESALRRAEEETKSISMRLNQLFFDSSRALLAAIFPEAQTERRDNLSIITAAYNEAVCKAHDYLQNVFNGVDLVLSTCVGNENEIPDHSCAARIS